MICNENLEMCKMCGGQCCKQMGCHYSPKDFIDLSVEGLCKEIDKGHISIDWWDADPRENNDDSETFNNCELVSRAPFLRVRHRKPFTFECQDNFALLSFALYDMLADDDEPTKIQLCPVVDASWGGCPCSLLTETGCSLSFEDRPLGGKALIPDFENHCVKTSYEKQECAIEWLPYNNILEDLICKYVNE